MIAINKHQISTVTLLLYTPAGPNGHIQPTCVFPRSIFHPTTLSKIPVMWLKKRDSIKSLIKTLKKKNPTSKVIWNNFTMCYKIINNKDTTFFPKCCWHFVWWSSVMDFTQKSCGILKFFVVPSEGMPCLRIDRHTYKNRIMQSLWHLWK